MDISSIAQLRTATFSGIKKSGAVDAATPIHSVNPPQHQQENRNQRSTVCLSVHTNPLHLVLKTVLVKIADTFGLQLRHIGQVSHLDLTPDTTVYHVLAYIQKAFDHFRQQQHDPITNLLYGDFIDRAHDAVTEGLLEARIILSNLKVYDEQQAITVHCIELSLHQRIDQVFKH